MNLRTKPKPVNCKNCSSKCAYDSAQLQCTIHHILFCQFPFLPPDNHHSSVYTDTVCFTSLAVFKKCIRTVDFSKFLMCNDV